MTYSSLSPQPHLTHTHPHAPSPTLTPPTTHPHPHPPHPHPPCSEISVLNMVKMLIQILELLPIDSIQMFHGHPIHQALVCSTQKLYQNKVVTIHYEQIWLISINKSYQMR
jgi:hypothetical protein